MGIEEEVKKRRCRRLDRAKPSTPWCRRAPRQSVKASYARGLSPTESCEDHKNLNTVPRFLESTAEEVGLRGSDGEVRILPAIMIVNRKSLQS